MSSNFLKAIRITVAVVLTFVVLLSAGLIYLWSITVAKIEIVSHKAVSAPSGHGGNNLLLTPTQKLKNLLPNDSDVLNVLLMGVDNRDDNAITERSDAMMVLSVNTREHQIKLLSLQRDMLVTVPGLAHLDKLTHVNSYGGPELVMRVLNENLRMRIDRYVVVNMHRAEGLIDLIGGIYLPIDEGEIATLNAIISTDAQISQPGLQLLNGHQAVSFARNRTNAKGQFDGDYARMYRQRLVLQAALNQVANLSLLKKLDLLSAAMSLLSTNLEHSEIVSMVTNVLPVLNQEIRQMQVPIEGFYQSYSGRAWVNLCDYNGMIPQIQKFIYGKTFPFDPVPEIPGAPRSATAYDESLLPWVGSASPTTTETTLTESSSDPSSTKATSDKVTSTKKDNWFDPNAGMPTESSSESSETAEGKEPKASTAQKEPGITGREKGE